MAGTRQGSTRRKLSHERAGQRQSCQKAKNGVGRAYRIVGYMLGTKNVFLVGAVVSVYTLLDLTLGGYISYAARINSTPRGKR